MKKILRVMGLWSILTTCLFSQISSLSQISSGTTSSSSQTSSRQTTTQIGQSRVGREGQLPDLTPYIMGGYLRHPDPEIRKQALMSLVYSMGVTQERGRRGQEGVRSIFYFGQEGRRREGTTGAGGATFIPDLYALLHDPDPEVRDLAAVALDILFNTDLSLLKFMEDPDPLVRKYAVKIYSERSLRNERDRGRRENDYEYVTQLFALRTLLVKLKYEKDPGVRKVISDAIEQFVLTERMEGGRERNIIGGIDQSIIDYLNDDNPVVRKNALKIIASMEYNPAILNILIERLKVEKDEEVKTLIENTIETLSGGAGRPGGRIR